MTTLIRTARRLKHQCLIYSNNINILPAGQQYRWCNIWLERGDGLSDSEAWKQNNPSLLPPNHPICSESDQSRGGWEWGLIRAEAKGHRQRSIWWLRPTLRGDALCCLYCQHGLAGLAKKKRASLVNNLISVFVFTFLCITSFSYQSCEDQHRF